MARSTLKEYKIQEELKKLFLTKFKMHIGVGFNSDFENIKVISIIIFNGNLNLPSYVYLLEILKPYIISNTVTTTNQISIDLEKIDWTELLILIKLI